MNKEFDFKKSNVVIEPKFDKKVTKLDSNNYIVALSLIIERRVDLPFSMEVEVRGYFESLFWEKNEKDSPIGNSLAILFPYLRTIVSNLTLNANIPPYIIPLMNINKLFEFKANIRKSDDKK